MCTATEAKTLQQVYGRHHSFFRKVIPVKRVQKPVLWYTRLTVYGNPGRVVNGCAPEITHLFGAFEMEIAGRRSSSFLSTREGRGAAYFLRAYAGAPALCSSAGRQCRPKVTSGCPKRSEGGFPVGTRTTTAFPSGNRGAKPSGPPPARTYPSRPAHPEERAGWRHRSSPRRARVQRLHARRRQPQG